MLMLIGAINYNNNLAYLMTFLLASLSVVGILHTYRNLLQLSLSTGHIEPRFVGEPLTIPVRIDNRTGVDRHQNGAKNQAVDLLAQARP